MRKYLMMTVLTASGVASAARPIEVGPLPESVFADTETVTNRPFSLSNPVARHLLLSLDLTATASNGVEVAFGRDADGDGALSLDEIALAVGWDSGTWFIRQGLGVDSHDMAHWTAHAVTSSQVKRLTFALNLRTDRPKGILAAENGVPLVWNLPAELPRWMFSRDWDTVRLAVRGTDAPDERLWAKAKVDGTVLIIK